MTLDKGHLNEFENIAPPMVNALTIPVDGCPVIIYVCSGVFGERATREQVQEVAKRLELTCRHAS